MSDINLANAELRASRVDGLGLFAVRDFKKGDRVLEWNDENRYYTKEELALLPKELKRYVAFYDSKYLLIASPERYMNHSCDPNTRTDDSGVDIALRDIARGEEITGDYTNIKTLDGFTCGCGTASCKKIIPGLNEFM